MAHVKSAARLLKNFRKIIPAKIKSRRAADITPTLFLCGATGDGGLLPLRAEGNLPQDAQPEVLLIQMPVDEAHPSAYLLICDQIAY